MLAGRSLPHPTLRERAGTKEAAGTLTNELKSLSGGERSFTLVSYVLSLGRELRTPFFAMDEFDVFMDKVNRIVSMASILKFAWEESHVQFILISPLDTGVIGDARAKLNEALRHENPHCAVVRATWLF